MNLGEGQAGVIVDGDVAGRIADGQIGLEETPEAFIAKLVEGRIRVIDLTHTLSPDFPYISLPPEMGQAWPFRIEEV